MQLKYTKQNFRSPCSISCVLDILGDKWTLLIVRDALFKGYTSFGQFRDSTEKIASNILSNRLEKLVSNGVLTKNKNPENGLKYDYELTEVGHKLKPVLLIIGDWGFENIDGVNNVQDIIASYKEKKTEYNKT
ncbi:MAG: helix-turn-helix domain-containing protein [Aureibaculum sp.]|nr:helix-turn-helix domain-containing protein [Aureibaculum sp.]